MTNLPPYRWNSLDNLVLTEHRGTQESFSYSVKASLTSTSDLLKVSFIVEKSPGIDWIYSELSGSNLWGLWETDVVEFFLQGRDELSEITSPYIEFILSPKEKQFALKTIVPREETLNMDETCFQGYCEISENVWEARMSIPNPFPGAKYLFGNFHACLGSSERDYFSYSHKPSQKPDFHRPSQFSQLGERK